MMEITIGTILGYLVTGVSSVIAWFAANKWLFPLIKMLKFKMNGT